MEYVDIAGLVKGASDGLGLGNAFLSHIREVPIIAHVVRCFDSTIVTHVEKTVDPARDVQIIDTELMLSDLKVLEKLLAKRKMKGDKKTETVNKVANICLERITEGLPLRSGLNLSDSDEWAALHSLNLLSAKPVMYIANVGEEEVASGNKYTRKKLNRTRKWMRILQLDSNYGI